MQDCSISCASAMDILQSYNKPSISYCILMFSFHRQSLMIGTGDGLVPSGNKPLPEPNIDPDLCRHWLSVGHNESTDAPVINSPCRDRTWFSEFGSSQTCNKLVTVLQGFQRGCVWGTNRARTCKILTTPVCTCSEPVSVSCGHHSIPLMGTAISLAQKQLHSRIKMYGACKFMWPHT